MGFLATQKNTCNVGSRYVKQNLFLIFLLWKFKLLQQETVVLSAATIAWGDGICFVNPGLSESNAISKGGRKTTLDLSDRFQNWSLCR